MQRIQWNLSNQDTNGAEESVIDSEVSSFQRLKCTQEWYTWGGKRCPGEVSSVQECPHRERGRERFHCKCCCDGECCMYAMQAGLQFGQKAQYVQVCRWFDQVLIILCVYVESADRNPRMACCFMCVYVCVHTGIILYSGTS